MKICEKIVGGRSFIFFEGDKLIPIDRIRWIDLDDDGDATIHLVSPVECFTFSKDKSDDVRKFFNSGYWKD